MKKRKLKYNVIIESSVLYGKPIRKEVATLIANFIGGEKVIIRFYVPEIVLEESKKHFLDDFLELKQKYENTSKNLYELLKQYKVPKIKKSENQIFRIVENAFHANKIETLATPYTKIIWKNIVKKAVYKLPPFSPEKDKEKGFKDLIIAETVLDHLPRLYKNSNVVFLCNDGLLSDYIKSKTKRYGNFKVFQSVPDFESALRLHLLKNSNKLVEETTKEAENSFYKPLDKNSLFYREELPRKFIETYPTLFGDPKIQHDLYYGVLVWQGGKENWIPVSEPEYRVSKPVFIKEESNKYQWESSIIYRQIFENAETKSTALAGGYDNKGEHVLEFKVMWETPINPDGKINLAQSKILKIEHIPRQTMSNYPMFSMGTSMLGNATLAGQGTVPVFNPTASESASPLVSPFPSLSPSPSASEDEDSNL
ncbi:MAG: hypothetical protein A3F31_00555 [Candidatus Levybacteria bacterium RIFCSPHIGHO2_12_FULL_38_12]|nr:MAG: hypothetical protein A2770_02850 [Candidatus Levybacteria bacterium RIFCSPHIGHO2_01_FULL_38_12]OGH22756.1 MAG: hypothetical protein A3F31_00555 [Candidatus Levybacteria bacterium RIFCSPHIGHO2_12_FULL_38_12]OGH45009.1 MAG: hypothetical protein A3J14_03990 [Candidatus Levybacteria bacterium RIFCSPLOWO2_02_FULL_37_18]